MMTAGKAEDVLAEGVGAGKDEVVIQEGAELEAEDVDRGIAVIPEVDPSSTVEVMEGDIKVGDPGHTTPEEVQRLRSIIWKRRHLLIGKGNALPPAARGAICDIDVGDAQPVAQRVRKVRPQFLEKLFQLIKGLLKEGLIRPSSSSWASPIVIVIKKNGVDIRLCIDYRMVNALTKLVAYPMPLVSDLLEDLEAMLWFCSLDMASGFWVVSMTDCAREISAFITPFGLFEWLRMPFGLKNAPQIYQRLIDNVVYNTFRMSNAGNGESVDVFEDGIPADPAVKSLLARRSYIDDILIAGKSWDEICDRVDRLLDACDYWNISISVEKSLWGMHRVEYLGHKVGRDGIETNPKDLDAIRTLQFPTTLRGMQSFLGSINYYSRFIERHAVMAAILYEWRPRTPDAGEDGKEPTPDPHDTRAKNAFEMLKMSLVEAPLLRHFDPDRTPVILVYASGWAIAGALAQDHDGVLMPVKFTSRVLKAAEKNYHDAEKEILALLRVLDTCYAMLAGRTIRVLTRRSALGWIWKARGLQGRLAQWAALLSPWSLEILKAEGDEADVLGLVTAGLTPRAQMDVEVCEIELRYLGEKFKLSARVLISVHGVRANI